MYKHLQQLPNTRVSKPGSDISYGLNLRTHNPKKNNNINKDKDDQAKLKLMDDLKKLPEDQGFEDYKDVTIEGFARAQLAMYGWKEGMGVGRNAASKEDVKVRVYEKRVGREGLGCDRDDIIITKRISNHSKFKGLEKNEKKKKRGRVQSRDLEEDDRRKVKKQEVAWVASHIRVRVISMDFKDGRFYRKKGEVLDVIGAPTTCDLYMDDTKEIVQGVCQDFLQTVIPRPGGPVLVLYGKHKGAYGSLVEMDLDREIALVKDADTHEMLSVKLDQIAEFTGDPSSLGFGLCWMGVLDFWALLP